MRRAALGIVLLLLAVAGCGSSSPEDPVKDAYLKFVHALADGEGDTACSLMTDGYKVTFTAAVGADARDCPTTVTRLTGDLPDSAREAAHDVEVHGVKLDDDRASVDVSQGQAVLAVPMEKVSGDWLVAGSG